MNTTQTISYPKTSYNLLLTPTLFNQQLLIRYLQKNLWNIHLADWMKGRKKLSESLNRAHTTCVCSERAKAYKKYMDLTVRNQ